MNLVLRDAHEIARQMGEIIRLLRALQPEEAARALNRTTLTPDLEHFLRGWIFHQQGNYDSAFEHFSKVNRENLEGDGFLSNRFDELSKTAQKLKDFEVFETANFSIRYQDGPDKVMLSYLPEVLENIYASYAKAFHFNRGDKIIVEVMPDYQLFAYASALTKEQIETTGTIALCVENRLVMITPRRVARGYYWPDVLAHEYVHYILTKHSRDNAPLWFQEGVAKYFETKWERPDADPLGEALETSLAKAIQKGEFLTVQQMMPSFAALPTAELAMQAYAQTASMVDYLCELQGEDFIYQVAVALRQEPEVDAVLRESLGIEFSAFEENWKQWASNRGYRIHAHVGGADGVKLLDEDESSEAIRELEEADEANKKHTRLGDLLLERGRYSAALKQYRKTVVSGEKIHRQVLLRMLRCQQHLNRNREIIEYIDENVTRVQEDATMLVYQARAYLSLDQKAKAIDRLDLAVRVNPFYPEIYRLKLLALDQDKQAGEVEKMNTILELLHKRPVENKETKS
ncbi:peptidase MA family metallohydrolase [Sulfidibacter corallicola]|uniref:Peptidase MA-like domain-containing protein n=1 Tax=Sulfidibacter corallicola TaxID=2818388 RepID=A0A8A4TMA9_SULCO|nr:hypothetical protein [Sulfidibacter corallicola]QTD47735.1 hypothetical protein J3U87_19270 [Sulfidibacter corallicola]